MWTFILKGQPGVKLYGHIKNTFSVIIASKIIQNILGMFYLCCFLTNTSTWRGQVDNMVIENTEENTAI